MKINGQFQNINRAIDYARIRSYIEIFRIYGVNEHISLTRFTKDNSYTFTELKVLKNK